MPRTFESVPAVTATWLRRAYLRFIEHGALEVNLAHKIATLVLATALLLPGALATMNQAAQIVA